MRTFFTADTHFAHKGILSPKMNRPRSFASIEEHDERAIAHWNDRVRPEDEVWHLGDFGYKGSASYYQSVFRRLHGRKHLVWGNHDHERTKVLPWYSQQERAEPVVEGVRIVLSHYAQRTWNRFHQGAIHAYGHSHGSLPGTARSLDVGVDDWQMRPVTMSEILERLAENAALETGPAAVAALAEAA
ncbi:metallophosphoesterase family protein [uncultured Methylobacterium sp.]|uniref:metallophosphoesterase family protein n=1 Tax=uncultured Methylobacterium sp. TaxID=157278 RepID=UPI0035C968CD